MSEDEGPGPQPETRFSDDRTWWWDGEQWQPIEGSSETLGRPPESPRTLPRADRRRGPLIGIGAVFLVLAVIAIGTAVWPALAPHPVAQGVPGATPTPTAHPRHSPAPTRKPTLRPSPSSSPSPAQQQQRYVQVVVTGAQRMGPEIDAVNQTCSSQSDLAGCRTSLVGLQSATRDFRQALASAPAPACLQPVDTELRQGLDLFDAGTSASIAGIDAQDPQRLVDGMQLVQQANGHLGQASTRAQSANC